MISFAALILAAILLFVATNIDDLLLLVAIHSDGRRSYPPRAVLLGQILGFTIIIVISLFGFWFNILLPSSWLACLGLFPFFMGCKQLIALLRFRFAASNSEHGIPRPGDPVELPRFSASWRRTASKVAVLTLANGSDNISIYLPAFSKFSSVELLVTVSTFYFSLLMLWSLSNWLAYHPRWQASFRRYGSIVAPIVFLYLGLWLLSDSVIARFVFRV